MHPRPERLGTVVVCEDDRPTRELLCENLAADRYDPLPAPTASDALRICRYGQPDLMVLDLTLPDAFGLDVLREIRGAGEIAPAFDPDLPIVILSGRGAERERVRGLEAGADDYVLKPFSYRELLARIAIAMRRRDPVRRGPIRIGTLTIDPARREVRVEGRTVALANKEFELLRLLASEPTRVHTKEELLREVWGFRAHSDRTRTVDSHASKLRRKLDPERGRWIVNSWGVGYRLVEG